MKILILSHSSEMAGAERSMFDLLDYWTKKHDVRPHLIIRRPFKDMLPEIKRRNWDYTAMVYTNWSQRTPSKKPGDIFRNATFNSSAVGAIEKLIEQHKPDVVMTNTIVSPWAAIAAYFQGVPHVWFVREYGDIDHSHVFELGKEKMLQDIDTMSDLVVTNSKTLTKHVGEHVDKAKLTTLYTPFDLDLLSRKAAQKAINPFKDKESLKLVITGKIAPSKGQAEATEAVGKLIEKGYKVELCVIGLPVDPEDAEPLSKVISQYQLHDKVHLVGHQSNPLAILAQADVGIMASRQEAFGRVTFEYMATGRPVVGANSGATPEMIDHGKNGLLYKLGDSADLVQQLEKYAKDRSVLKSHGVAAKRKAEAMMHSDHNADQLWTMVNELIKNKSPRPKVLNFSRRWLDYPIIAQRFIDDTHALAFRRIVYLKARHRAKRLYVWLTRKDSV